MEPTQIQENNPQGKEMTPDEAKASLGIATRLSEQFFNPKQDPTMAPEGSEMTPGDDMPQEEEQTEAFNPEAFKAEMMKEVTGIIKEEMSSMKEMISNALTDEEE